MFTMTPGWERFFHLCTYVCQGSSYLNPRGYAILHRMHHAYSDTEGDPHSPRVHRNPFRMMNHTRDLYRSINAGKFAEALPRLSYLSTFTPDSAEFPVLEGNTLQYQCVLLGGKVLETYQRAARK